MLYLGCTHVDGPVSLHRADYETAQFDFNEAKAYGQDGQINQLKTLVSDFKFENGPVPLGDLPQALAAAKRLERDGLTFSSDGLPLYDSSILGDANLLIYDGKLTRAGLGRILLDDLADLGDRFINNRFDRITNGGSGLFSLDHDYPMIFMKHAVEIHRHRQWVRSGKSSSSFMSRFAHAGEDSSNSAFQQVALILRSRFLGRVTNLTPADAIEDAYAQVVISIRAKAKARANSLGIQDPTKRLTDPQLRKIVKTGTFTTSYNVGETKALGTVNGKLRKIIKGTDEDLEQFLGDVFWDTAEEVFPEIFSLRVASRQISGAAIKHHYRRLGNAFAKIRGAEGLADTYLEYANIDGTLFSPRVQATLRKAYDDVVATEKVNLITRVNKAITDNEYTVRLPTADGSVIVDNFYQKKYVTFHIESPEGNLQLVNQPVYVLDFDSGKAGNALMSRIIQGSDANLMRDIGDDLISQGIEFEFIHDKFNVAIGDLGALNQSIKRAYARLYAREIDPKTGKTPDELRDFWDEIVEYMKDTDQLPRNFESSLEPPSELLTFSDVNDPRTKPTN